ncbi:Hypothetical predicted protein [Lynx pardinus]|uniref:Uncharacterized protein n=1 Tax=Lynx pardinus TaxID=191816 RepID=A0A485MW43_LYNPA|nr:Hypothetical predicted protein [Lynx pardinus]
MGTRCRGAGRCLAHREGPTGHGCCRGILHARSTTHSAPGHGNNSFLLPCLHLVHYVSSASTQTPAQHCAHTL